MSDTTTKRICREAIDAFVLKFTDKKYPLTAKKITYTTADGTKVNFTPADAMIKGAYEYYQLLGQTFPFHERKNDVYPISDLAYVCTKTGGKMMWAKNSEDVTSLISLGVVCNFITLMAGPDEKKVYIKVLDKVPTVHIPGIN